MKLRSGAFVLLFLVAVSFQPAHARANDDSPGTDTESHPNLRLPEDLVQLKIPVDSEYAAGGVSFSVEKPEQAKIPLSLARRLFSETLRAALSTVNAGRPIKLRLHLILRLGQKREFLYIHEPEGTMISMKNWDEVVFARLLARAVPSSILSEKDADEAAVQALRQVHATIDVRDMNPE